MATGNLFLGTARKSVGDVTFYVYRGVQRSRARRRVVANPRTVGQLIQRAVMGNVSHLYSVGKAIFDHAFEGRSSGQDNQLRFNRVNQARLKGLLVSDWDALQAGTISSYDDYTGRIGVRGMPGAAPFIGLQVSEGSYEQSFWHYDAEEFVFNSPTPAPNQTVKQYAAANGLLPGDIYTYLTFAQVATGTPLISYGSDPMECLFPCRLKYLQLLVKDTVTDDETVIDATVKFNKLFTLYAGDGLDNDVLAQTFGSSLDPEIFGGSLGGHAVIRSKYASPLRSTSLLVPSNPDGPTGLTVANLIEAWGNSESVATVDEVLEGENFDPYAPAVLGAYKRGNVLVDEAGKIVVIATLTGSNNIGLSWSGSGWYPYEQQENQSAFTDYGLKVYHSGSSIPSTAFDMVINGKQYRVTPGQGSDFTISPDVTNVYE